MSFLALARASAPAQETTWPSIATKQSLKITVLKPEGFNSNQPAPLIVYLENLAAPRIGTDSDEAIIRRFSEGWLSGRHAGLRPPSPGPCARLSIETLGNAGSIGSQNFLPGIEIDPAHIFIIPSGHRLLRDIVFYREPDRTLAMDIIYPSHPAKPVGAVIEFSCDNVNRMGNGSLSICSDTILDAEATEGFAVAMADHPVKAPYKGIDPMPDCAWKIKAAVRTLRAEGHPWPQWQNRSRRFFPRQRHGFDARDHERHGRI